MAIRCYVGHGNDYKEKKCALDDHSCIKEYDGSIIFPVKSIFHENFHENDFSQICEIDKNFNGNFDTKSQFSVISFVLNG